ncbi:MAG: hypothetical protein ACTHOP_08005 [Mesorhizobium sp.]
MTSILLITHLSAIALGILIGGAYSLRKIQQRETAAELRGLLANVVTIEDAARRVGA